MFKKISTTFLYWMYVKILGTLGAILMIITIILGIFFALKIIFRG